MQLSEFTERLNAELQIDQWAGADYAVNGLQVGPESTDIGHVAFAVDGVVETAEQAAAAGADLLVVHHGISWGGIDRITDKEYERVQALLDADIALYAAHAPLDGHDEYGNAARLCDRLGLDIVGPFGENGPGHVGQRGHAPTPFSTDELRDELTTLEGADEIQVLDFGPAELSDIAVLTGSGTDWLDEARELGVDALITGEGKQPAYHEAREAGISVFLAGHYATETLGVTALRSLTETWGLETTYVSHPTGL